MSSYSGIFNFQLAWEPLLIASSPCETSIGSVVSQHFSDALRQSRGSGTQHWRTGACVIANRVLGFEFAPLPISNPTALVARSAKGRSTGPSAT